MEMKMEFPSIHSLSISACPCRVTRELRPISSGHWASAGVHPGQVTIPSQDNSETHRTSNNSHNTLISKEDIEKPINLTVMFLHCGGKPEYSERTWQLHCKDHKSEFEHRTLVLQGNSAAKQLILQPDDGTANHFIIILIVILTITLGLVGIVVTNVIIIFKSVFFYLLHYQHSCWPLCISLPF
ncbi:hypothetical protein CRENBAI_014079 [Crenichthys baileyi]|uniref:Uncharacterized protein n=1 Tax=Crenichthys baileyi TaxID=28760 RepID=A0AAV9RS67_9TELE